MGEVERTVNVGIKRVCRCGRVIMAVSNPRVISLTAGLHGIGIGGGLADDVVRALSWAGLLASSAYYVPTMDEFVRLVAADAEGDQRPAAPPVGSVRRDVGHVGRAAHRTTKEGGCAARLLDVAVRGRSRPGLGRASDDGGVRHRRSRREAVRRAGPARPRRTPTDVGVAVKGIAPTGPVVFRANGLLPRYHVQWTGSDGFGWTRIVWGQARAVRFATSTGPWLADSGRTSHE